MARTTVYNNIVTEENLTKVCSDNKELLNEFLEFCESTDKSPLTIINYKSDIEICFVWSLIYNKNKFFIDFNKRDIMKYQNYLLHTLKLGSSRIRRLRSSISSMANFVESMMDDIYPEFRNIINKIPAPAKNIAREKTVLEDKQVQDVLDYLISKQEYQKACVLALAWGSGRRKSELLRFKVSYFKDQNIVFGALYKTPEKIKTKGRGSQGKLLNCYTLVNKFKKYFELWMNYRKNNLDVDEELDDVLFIIKRKNKWIPAQISTLDSWTREFSRLFNTDFYFHCLRHNFCTGLLIAGIPASVIKEIIGWTSIEMVNIYNDQEIDDQLGKYFDENGIKQIEQKGLSDL